MKKNSILLLFLLILSFGCNKPKMQYWPPSKYGDKLKKSEENYRKGKKEGLSVYWHKNGNKQMECNYTDGKLNGMMMRWYYNGNQERIDNYKNDILEGYSKTFYQNGTVESEVNYKNGLLDGVYKVYWENGEPKIDGKYVNGWYDGNWTFYDYTGIKIGEALFANGNGKQYEFSIKNGSKTKETNFLKNKKNGIETWWDESGKKIKEVVYKDDKISETILY